MSVVRSFPRRVDALEAIFAFTAGALAGRAVGAGPRHNLDFAIEELFTNMIKYSRSASTEVRIELVVSDGDVAVVLVDSDVDAFDVTAAPDADVGLPAQRRTPGGLGLHLVRRLVDSLSYAYDAGARQSRIGFRVSFQPPPGSGAPLQGGSDVDV